MSEPTYPEAWGVLVNGYWLDELSGCEDVAHEKLDDAISDQEEFDGESEATDISGWHVVRLLPKPTVDRLIAEAVAAAVCDESVKVQIAAEVSGSAERDRCQRLVDRARDEGLSFGVVHDETFKAFISLLSELCGAIRSGHEPGEGGAT